MATVDLGKIKITWKGAYNASTEYEKDDAVSFSGSSYVHVGTEVTTGTAPEAGGNATWDVMASGTPDLTTAGDIAVHDGSTAARLGIGTEKYVLTSQGPGSAPHWALPDTRYGNAVIGMANAATSGEGGYRSGGVLLSDTSLRVWGNAAFASHGNGSYLVNTSHPIRPALPASAGVITKWVRSYYSNIILASGQLYAWGGNAQGQLGMGNTLSVNVPTLIPGLESETIVDVVMTGTHYNVIHVLALTASGKIFVCGDNGAGQLGDGTTVDKSTFTQITGTAWTAIFAGGSANAVSYAIDATGDLYSWGHNLQGELGVGDTTRRTTPTLVNLPAPVDTITVTHGDLVTTGASHAGHVLALLQDGRVFSWGYNGFGQLGDGTLIDKSGPVEITSLGADNTSVFSAGGANGASGCTKADGTIRLWGMNGGGSCGDGTVVNKTTPFAPTLTGNGGIVFAGIFGSFSYHFTAVLFADGTIKVAGYNGNFNLGLGDSVNRTTFTEVPFRGQKPVELAPVGVSLETSLAVRTEEGGYFQTGFNTDYQAGIPHGTDTGTLTPLIF